MKADDELIIHHYSLDKYNFPELVRGMLDVPLLVDLHQRLNMPDRRRSDQDTPAHRKFYDRFSKIRPWYERFLHDEILPLVAEPVYVQRVPTFRVSEPGGTAVSRFHRDSEYHHQPGTINFWVPLTPAFGSNTIWVESAPDRGDFHPIEMSPGQMLQFDALTLRHGNRRNETGKSRVSFDFRIVSKRSYQSTGRRAVSSRIPLEVGQYYVDLADCRSAASVD